MKTETPIDEIDARSRETSRGEVRPYLWYFRTEATSDPPTTAYYDNSRDMLVVREGQVEQPLIKLDWTLSRTRSGTKIVNEDSDPD